MEEGDVSPGRKKTIGVKGEGKIDHTQIFGDRIHRGIFKEL